VNAPNEMSILQGVIDIHVHTSPDVRMRSVTDLSLAAAARDAGVRAVVIKSHYVPTADRAWIASQVVPEVAVFGGITLNPSVGGLNRHAVEAAIRLGAKIVWLPTLFASNHRQKEGQSGGIACIRDGKPVPELSDIMKLIAEHNIALATGHLASDEILAVVEEAAKLDVRKIIINHPEHEVVDMPIARQLELAAAYPIAFERCYAQPAGNGKYKSNLEVNLEAIRKVGFHSTIIATDAGQVENPLWRNCLEEYIQFMLSQGIAPKSLDWMTRRHPARMLGLELEQELQ
jgi:hypothetical protein